MDYEKDIRIDETALDVEWLDQPRLMMQYARHAADTKRDVDLVKEQLDLTRAELDKEIRSNPEDYDISGKITESVISNTIITQPEYKKTAKEYSDAKFEYDVAQAAVRAVDQRKTALENLVKLYGQQYFAGPSVPRNLNKEWEEREMQKRADKKVATGMRRNK